MESSGIVWPAKHHPDVSAVHVVNRLRMDTPPAIRPTKGPAR